MKRHLGRSDLDSIIDSMPDGRSARHLMLDAVNRFGVVIIEPFTSARPKRLTTGGVAPKVRGYNAQHIALSEPLEVEQPMLSQTFAPAPIISGWGLPADVPERFAPAVEKYASRFRAEGTLQRYYSCWKKIVRICLDENVCPLPMSPGVAMSILAHIADATGSFGEVKAVRDTIAFVHTFKQFPDPTKDLKFSRVWDGIVRSLGTGHPNAKIAFTRDEVGRMIQIAIRRRHLDHAVAMAVAFEGALRVSELCEARIEDVFFLGGTTQLLIPRAKTDQGANGAWVRLELRQGAPFNASAMLLDWIKKLNRPTGYLFGPFERGQMLDEPIHARTFRRYAKTYAACLGIDPKTVGSHSFRAGWVTEEVHLGRPTAEIVAHVRHATLHTILDYYRPRGNPRNLTRYSYRDFKLIGRRNVKNSKARSEDSKVMRSISSIKSRATRKSAN